MWLKVTGDAALAARFAAVLEQCGLDVRTGEPAGAGTYAEPAPGLATVKLAVTEGDNPLVCHIAANDDGLCWSFADIRSETPAASPLTAFRRAASLGASTTSSDRHGVQIPRENFMTIAATQVARNILCRDHARPTAGTITFLDSRTLRTSVHRVPVHPYDEPARQRTHDGFRHDLGKLQSGAPMRRQELTERWQLLSDQRFGPFAGPDDTRLRQLPLKATLVRLSDPCGLLSAPAAVVGVGTDKESARERAIIQALAAYGSIVVDPRRLVDANGAFLGPRECDAARLLEPVRDGSANAFVRAIDLTDGRQRLLPARQAFGVLRAPGTFHTPCGTSTGFEWPQALAHALLQHCVRLTVSGSSGRTRPPSALAAEDFDHDSGVRFLTAMAKAAGLDLTMHEITGPAGVPVVACASSSGEKVYGGGVNLVEAVREALTAALFRYQLRCDPVLKAAASTATAVLTGTAAWTRPASSASLSPGRLVHAVTSLGFRPSVFALDHDRAVHEAFPYVLRVILEPESGQ